MVRRAVVSIGCGGVVNRKMEELKKGPERGEGRVRRGGGRGKTITACIFTDFFGIFSVGFFLNFFFGVLLLQSAVYAARITTFFRSKHSKIVSWE